jgi:hypothetical protein
VLLSALSGSYSATLTGGDLNSAVAFSNASQAVGSVVFDGLSKVTFTLTNNSNKFFGVAQTLSGTYSLQSNCIGVLTITTGDTASFTLEAYNLGKIISSPARMESWPSRAAAVCFPQPVRRAFRSGTIRSTAPDSGSHPGQFPACLTSPGSFNSAESTTLR